MNRDLMIALGFEKGVKRVENGRCPFCGKVVSWEEFRDAESEREFWISGLCQACQDAFFGRE